MKTHKNQRSITFLKKFKYLDIITNYIFLYVTNCSIHGLIYLVKNGITIMERLLWLCLLVSTQYFCLSIALSSLNRYFEKNTHVGLERDFYFWNTSLPSLTICPLKRIDPDKFDIYCETHNIAGERKENLFNFLEQLANSTYKNFKDLPAFETIPRILDELNVQPQQYMELIYNLTFDRTYNPNERDRIRCAHDNIIIHVRQVLTEYGLCYTANNFLNDTYSSNYFILGSQPQRNLYEEKRGTLKQVLMGTFFDKDVSYTFVGFPDAIDLFIHSPYDVMKVDNNFGYADEFVEYDPTSMEILTSENFDKATVHQRRCRFPHESNLTHYPIYTKNLCLQECRLNLVYKICHCIPHFYPNRFLHTKPVCDYRVLRECVAEHSEYFLKIYKEGDHPNNDRSTENVECYCDENCEESILSVQSASVILSTKYLLGSLGAQVSMKNWPRGRLIRTVIFSFSDVLVYFGGTAGLFMGFSVLGFIELIYFFTIRLLFHVLRYTL